MAALDILFVAIAAYGAVLIVGLLLGGGLRTRLVELVAEFDDEQNWNDEERRELDWMLASCTSSAVGMLLPIASAFTAASFILGAESPPDAVPRRLEQDPRFEELVGKYMGSVMLANPLAALLSMPFLLLTWLVVAARGKLDVMRALEKPVLSALTSLQPRRRTC